MHNAQRIKMQIDRSCATSFVLNMKNRPNVPWKNATLKDLVGDDHKAAMDSVRSHPIEM